MIRHRGVAAGVAGLLGLSVLAGCSGDSDDASEPTAAPTNAMLAADQRWWDDRTFYEIFVRSFADSDGDGIGDLPGVIDRLDYLNDGDPATDTDLGVTGIWLMPIFASPSYHGYDVTDYRTVNPEYGTVEDLRALVEAAHQRGIAVILDYPMNHTSTQHPWFQESRTGSGDHADWYVWIDGTSSETGPWGQQVWHPDGDRSYLGIFWDGMPDLNLTNPDVTEEIEDIARYWLSDVGVDGFRLDGAQHLVEQDGVYANTAANKDWLAGFNAFVKGVRSDALLVGEVWIGTQISKGYVPSQVDLVFDFDSSDAARSSAGSGFGSTLLKATEKYVLQFPDRQVAVFTDNHDKDRLASFVGDDPGRLRFIATWLVTQPGVPFIYYGQEIGLPGKKPDELIRTPLPWTGDDPAGGFTSGTPWEPLADGWQERNVAAQQADDSSLMRHYARLVAARNAAQALRHGDYEALETEGLDSFAFLRRTADDVVLVLGNAGGSTEKDFAVMLPEGLPGGSWTSMLGQQIEQPSGSGAYSPVDELDAWETLVLHLEQ